MPNIRFVSTKRRFNTKDGGIHDPKLSGFYGITVQSLNNRDRGMEESLGTVRIAIPSFSSERIGCDDEENQFALSACEPVDHPGVGYPPALQPRFL